MVLTRLFCLTRMNGLRRRNMLRTLICHLRGTSEISSVGQKAYNMPCTGVKDVDQQQFVVDMAAFLKKSGKVKVPEWADIVKTSIARELAPYDRDWFYIRTASIARHLYMRPNAGLGALKKIYGGRKRNGVRPNHFQVCHGNHLRKALQQLEALKMAEKTPEGGRRLTNQGRRDLDRIASQVFRKMGSQHLTAQPVVITPPTSTE